MASPTNKSNLIINKLGVKKVKHYVFLAALLGTLTACGSSDDNNDTNNNGGGNGNTGNTVRCESSNTQPLVGCWASNACVEQTQSPGYYSQAVIDVRNDGSLVQGMNIYLNSTCTGTPEISGFPLKQNYAVLGSTATTGGLTANYLSITFPGFSAINYAAYYISADPQLCFATGQFTVNGSGGGLAPTYTQIPVASVTIDVAPTSCLVPMN